MESLKLGFVLGLSAVLFIVIGVLLEKHSSSEDPPFDSLPICQNEDGNTDGKPCVWVHKRTGIAYYVDSSNYRD